jgi:predicted enzyme related to lactoylglutathione lyase
MAELAKPRLVGFNHVALEVGDIEEALAFYGRLFRFELRGKSDSIPGATASRSSTTKTSNSPRLRMCCVVWA